MKLALVVALLLAQTVVNIVPSTSKQAIVICYGVGPVYDFNCYYNEVNGISGPCLPVPKELKT